MTAAEIAAQLARVNRAGAYFDKGDKIMVDLVNGLAQSYSLAPLSTPAAGVTPVQTLPGASGGSGLDFGQQGDNSDLYREPGATAPRVSSGGPWARVFPPTPASPVTPFLAPGVAADPIGMVRGRRAALAANQGLLGRVRVNADAVVPSSPCFAAPGRRAEPTGLIGPVAATGQGSLWGWLIGAGLVIAALASNGQERSRRA